MIIGIDGNEANQKIRVGSGVYAFELLRQFNKSSPPAGGLEFRIYLKDKPIRELPPPNECWKYKIIGPKKFWTQLALPLYLWKEKILNRAPDVFFTPTHYAPRYCPIPSVITIFDLSFIKYPDMFLKKDLYKLKNWTKYSIRQAKKIITISEFSKKEIINHYNVNPDDVIVAYPGYNKKRFNLKVKSPASPAGRQNSRIKSTMQKFKINNDYILYIGTLQPRKNIKRLLEAFEGLNDKNLKLVIVGMIKEGRGGWMSDELLHSISSDIIVTGYVDNDDLPYLISGAKALVLPSLYEGFGIPVVEAMACGIPAVVSNVSSLPEIAHHAAILVDPHDTVSIMSGLKEACYNKVKREELIKKGLIQAQNFNWEKSARTILETLIHS